MPFYQLAVSYLRHFINISRVIQLAILNGGCGSVAQRYKSWQIIELMKWQVGKMS
jgi:hypothetical protein